MISRKAIFISIIPIAIIGIYIFLFGLNFPFWDQWEVVPLLIKKQQGLLFFVDLFAQHNEHRPFFPRLIWVTLAQFTHYNVIAELWLNLLIAVWTFMFFINRTIKMWSQLKVPVSPLLIPLISFLVFNLSQCESWLQGIQTVMFLEMACVVIGLFLLAEIPAWGNFFGAIALGVVANYSMVNGLFYWLVGLIVIWVTTSKKMRIIRISLWIFFSAACIGLFFSGWVSGGQLNFRYVFSHALEWYLWILNFLGAPIMTQWYVAWVFGIISVASYILILGLAIRTGQWKPLVPYFAIVLFILLTTFSISLGRMEIGLIQSTVSRYLTLSVWYWASLLALFPLLNLKIFYQRTFYSLVTISLVFLMVLGGWRGYESLHKRILPAYQAVTSGQPVSDEVLLRIYPFPNIARERLEFLCANKLSACADKP
jgi:hypothetical protein